MSPPSSATTEAGERAGRTAAPPGRRQVEEPSADIGGQPRHRDSRSGDDPGDCGEPRRKEWFRRPAVLVTGGLVLLLLLAGVTLYWWHSRGFESTDDAFIDSRIVRVSPRISGQVVAVHVDDNQLVTAGQAIVDIDPAETRAALDEASAQQAQAETALKQARADVNVAEAQHRQALAAITGAEAQAENAAQDLKRYLTLKASTPQAVAQGQIDQATAAARNAAAQRDAARQQANSAAAQVAAAGAAVAGEQAKVETARAQAQQAQLNFSYTRLKAAVTGHVARRTVAVGNYVAPGQELMAIVPLQVWVTANFKETQLDRMRVGQRVTVSVDACPGVDMRAHVDSIQRGAGQAFQLLPPENATGNYIKVVQRVPVKIVLEEAPRGCPLGPGMSVEPSVRVR